ncbi:MAG TPA: DUF5654 family protein [Candidatus Nanoarchaeia archaeon]|nr:DUF5654 family protein [Candidatus Nanoarchaeia archaeon]
MAKKVKSKKISKSQIAKQKLKNFNIEFKKATATAIIAAFGFLIALVWRDVITEFVESITNESPVQGKLISAIIITIISVLGILILTKINQEKK